jgi:hypothetical protein
MDVSKIIGFILPDWIADIVPGKYPVHSEDGTVKPNFKSKILNIVTGEFNYSKYLSYGSHMGLFFKSIFRFSFWNYYWCTSRFIYGSK